ncbi:hypothetical protein [Burkholderia sp. Ac-20365]|uniref:hypothetical protein n=1 Tax=Burkholderia sp. Ac-20365 TaxID=2703897 RepID=UPI00197BFE7E|nr:hypothetical protein [Burkholderia sp. Ac-20365]MBN3761176.1 hypothetical protein [Burkholderia sp. Ac-20365]
MKILAIATLVASCVLSTSVGAQTLSHADQFDIKTAAEYAVKKATMKAGEPVATQGGYIVPVTVAGTKCKVFVHPYKAKSDFAPPMRWDSDPAVCDK